jgi:ATP-dependent DNA helicase RecG
MLPTSRPLPIQLDDLLASESVRLELKKTFDDQTLDSAMRTICAFANDFLEVNGGYLIFGVESDADTG